MASSPLSSLLAPYKGRPILLHAGYFAAWLLAALSRWHDGRCGRRDGRCGRRDCRGGRHSGRGGRHGGRQPPAEARLQGVAVVEAALAKLACGALRVLRRGLLHDLLDRRGPRRDTQVRGTTERLAMPQEWAF